MSHCLPLSSYPDAYVIMKQLVLLFVVCLLQIFGHALLLKGKDDKKKFMFGSKDEQVLQKWWEAMYLAQYVALTLNIEH